jgi:hypothetical protein
LAQNAALGERTVMRYAAVAALLLVSLLPAYVVGDQDRTLAQVLAHNSLTYDSSSVSHLNDPITSYATLNNENEFVIAYYLVAPRNELHFPLLLARFDKQSGKWQEASLTDLKVKLFEGKSLVAQDECIGSAVRLARNSNWYYLDLHWNPLAGCLLILKHDLSVHQNPDRGNGCVLQIRAACVRGEHGAICAGSSGYPVSL